MCFVLYGNADFTSLFFFLLKVSTKVISSLTFFATARLSADGRILIRRDKYPSLRCLYSATVVEPDNLLFCFIFIVPSSPSSLFCANPFPLRYQPTRQDRFATIRTVHIADGKKSFIFSGSVCPAARRPGLRRRVRYYFYGPDGCDWISWTVLIVSRNGVGTRQISHFLFCFTLRDSIISHGINRKGWKSWTRQILPMTLLFVFLISQRKNCSKIGMALHRFLFRCFHCLESRSVLFLVRVLIIFLLACFVFFVMFYCWSQ